MIIRTDNDGLRIELHGKEQLFALRAKIEVPRGTITSLRFEPVFQDWRRWEVRMPGTAAPKLLLAGSYWTEEGWDFLYIKRPRGVVRPFAENVLVVETNQNRYTRIILSCAEEEAGKIVGWWKKNPSSKASSGKAAKDKRNKDK